MLALLAAMLMAGNVSASDTEFTYQGSLKENGQSANGSFDLEFSLWDAPSGGTQIGSTVVLNGVQVTDGLFTVQLDFGASAFDNSDRWLEIVVDSMLLSPRQPITRAPYSIQTRGIFVDELGLVGIGTTTPQEEIHVRGIQATLRLVDTVDPLSFTEIRDAQPTQLRINKISNGGLVLFDLNPKPVDGVSSASVRLFRETNTTGLRSLQLHRGNNTSQLSALIGVDGADSFFQAHGGYLGIGTTDPQWPLHVEGDSTAAIYANAPTWGILGETTGTDTASRGVYGLASATTGDADGVLGWSFSNGGKGVRGLATALSGANVGVVGRSDSIAGTGVYGLASTSTGTNYGVRGQSNSATGFDFYAAGAGTNYGSSSSIRWKHSIEAIDEPLKMIDAMRGVYFDWDAEHGGHHDVGMIAEEVGVVLPEIVGYEENGIDAIGMDYSKLTPLLVEAIKALRAENQSEIAGLCAEKDSEMAALRAENSELRARLDGLETIMRTSHFAEEK